MTTTRKRSFLFMPVSSQCRDIRLQKTPADGCILTTVLVGPSKKRFKVDKHLLVSSSPFFASQLAEASRRSNSLHPAKPKPVALWLPLEDPTAFSLYVEWLSYRACFLLRVGAAISKARSGGAKALNDLHWGLVRLHLLAANLSLWQLQDVAMDAIQDIYRQCGWDVTPEFVDWLYSLGDDAAIRVKRWAVAMMAFAIARASRQQPPQHARMSRSQRLSSIPGHLRASALNAPSPAFRHLLDKHSELSEDYAIHLRKMRASRLAIRWKDPRVRVDANRLQNDDRAHGFRQCSFHSHRAAVGEDQCPHAVVGWAASSSDGESDFSPISAEEGGLLEENGDRAPGGLTAPRWSRRKEKGAMLVDTREVISGLPSVECQRKKVGAQSKPVVAMGYTPSEEIHCQFAELEAPLPYALEWSGKKKA